MKSETLGTVTSEAEVTNISRHGFWLLLDGRELFLPFEEFPWFKKAPVEAILNVERPQPHHLYWPELDVDLTVESIECPEKYPLKWKVEGWRVAVSWASHPRQGSRLRSKREGRGRGRWLDVRHGLWGVVGPRPDPSTRPFGPRSG